jgi:DNA-binding PadR family transcriptional regulator
VKHLVLALLAHGPAHGYELKRRHDDLFAGLSAPINIGQIYVTLGRLERDGLVSHTPEPQAERPDRKVYVLLELGRKTLDEWLAEPAEISTLKSDVILKLISAWLVDGVDPRSIITEHRQRCLQTLRQLDRLAGESPAGTIGELLVQGSALHLQAELRWLDLCEQRLDTLRPPALEKGNHHEA